MRRSASREPIGSIVCGWRVSRRRTRRLARRRQRRQGIGAYRIRAVSDAAVQLLTVNLRLDYELLLPRQA